MIALSGVRSSWLMLARNCDLRSLASASLDTRKSSRADRRSCVAGWIAGPLYQVRSHPVMHLQIVEVNAQLTGRYVASPPHSWTMRIGPAESRGAGWNSTSGWNVKGPAIRAWGQNHSGIWDRWAANRGRLEGATAEKAVPFPCAARRSVVLRLAELTCMTTIRGAK